MISLEHVSESYTLYGIVHSTLWIAHRIMKKTNNGKLILDRCKEIYHEELARLGSGIQI